MYRIYTTLSVPKVGQKIQMEGVQLILMNAAPKSAKVPQTGAPLIHLSGASIHLEVFGVDLALKDTQVSNLYTFYTAHYLFKCESCATSFMGFFNFSTVYSVFCFFLYVGENRTYISV